jgi:penicillin-binding protein 2
VPDVAWHDRHIKGGYQRGMPVNLAIGQGDVNVTPMQQVVFYGALATGILWKPQIVLRVEDADGKVLKEFGPIERGRPVIHEATRETVLKGLLAAVNQPFGTGYAQRPKDFIAAGKTGTAQVVKMGAKRIRAESVPYFERDHAWFATFAPAEDPQIVVVVLNEHSGFGATHAAPAAMAIVKKWMELKAQDAAERAGVPVAQPPTPSAVTPPIPSPRGPAPAPAALAAGAPALPRAGTNPAPGAEVAPVPASAPADARAVPVPAKATGAPATPVPAAAPAKPAPAPQSPAPRAPGAPRSPAGNGALPAPAPPGVERPRLGTNTGGVRSGA